MNTQLKTLMLLSALLIGAGCASESGGNKVADVPTVACTTAACTTVIVPTPTPTPINQYTGATVPLQITSISALQKMFYRSYPTNPQNVTINIDVSRGADSVILSYTNNGVVYEAALGTVHPSGTTSNSMYNGWVTQDGKQIWKGFFQDYYGAIIIIVDKFLSQGDGQAPNILGGSIWFQNFDKAYPKSPTQGPTKMCWEISIGNHDCRTWISGDFVNPTQSYYPNNKGPDQINSYQKLGDFTGMTRSTSGL